MTRSVQPSGADRSAQTFDWLSSEHAHCYCLVLQSAGDDAGVVPVRPAGGPGCSSTLLPLPGSAAPAAAGLPVCRGNRQPCAVE